MDEVFTIWNLLHNKHINQLLSFSSNKMGNNLLYMNAD